MTDTERGFPITITVTQVAPRGSGHRIEVHGQTHSWIVENPDPTAYARGFSLRRARHPRLELRDVELQRLPGEGEFEDSRSALFASLLERFLEATRGGGGDAVPTFEDGLRAQRLMEGALRSSETGGWIELDTLTCG